MTARRKSNDMETPFGRIPDGWEMHKLGEFCSLITKGTTPTTLGYQYQEAGINFIKVESIDQAGNINLRKVAYIDGETNKALARSQLKCGDILYSIAGAIGRSAIVREHHLPANTNQALALIRPIAGIDAQYLRLVLSSERQLNHIAKISVSSAQENISLKDIRSFDIAIPPLPEQQKIAAILTTVDDKLDVIARQIATTKTLKQGLMQTLFSRGVGTQDTDGRWVPHTDFKDTELGEIPAAWSCNKLDMHVAKVGSGVTPKGGSTAYLASGIPLIRSQNVLVGRLALDDVAFISDEQHARMRGSTLLPNDVLLNITGASIGRCAVLPSDFTEGNVNQHVCIIRPRPSLNPHYLCHYLNAETGQRQIEKFQAGGNREGLNFQQIRSFDVPVPSFSEQGKIASILGSIDEKLAVLSVKAIRYQTVKRGLMQKVLTGEWRVKCDALVAETAATGLSTTNVMASAKSMSSLMEEAL